MPHMPIICHVFGFHILHSKGKEHLQSTRRKLRTSGLPAAASSSRLLMATAASHQEPDKSKVAGLKTVKSAFCYRNSIHQEFDNCLLIF